MFTLITCITFMSAEGVSSKNAYLLTARTDKTSAFPGSYIYHHTCLVKNVAFVTEIGACLFVFFVVVFFVCVMRRKRQWNN